MRASKRLMWLHGYVGILLLATAMQVQAAAADAGVDSLAVFFWKRIDWASFGTAGFISLVAGAVRTGMTLRSEVPTYRVLQEGAVDAAISLVVGALAFLMLMIWQTARGPVNQWVMVGCIFAAGLLRGGFISLIEESTKRLLSAVTDGAVGWIAAKAAAAAATKTELPKDGS
ncbi:hypothetical protein RCH06_001878 [Polaromonas sp. CG_9.5]|uniref:hypothetical protein n=1 Tax=Polaromonas sp. CG_9.5 TaxID=3071705 RepID=UPI002E0C0CA7|nr:hypothetical protein [Polaromonas sp. CG_9.5]